jgi:predicted membrane channel-forming protein YqfA (hemolysin III family)
LSFAPVAPVKHELLASLGKFMSHWSLLLCFIECFSWSVWSGSSTQPTHTVNIITHSSNSVLILSPYTPTQIWHNINSKHSDD